MAITGISFLLDTSAYSGFYRGDARLRKWFTTRNTIYVPLIVIGELRAGFANGSKTSENEDFLERFLDSFPVQTLLPTLKTTEHFATLYSAMRLSGTPINTNDLWIAALASEHTLPILTLDTDFQKIKTIKVIGI